MIALLVVTILVLVLLVVSVFLLGFRLASGGWLERITEIQAHATEAQRRMSDLSRQAMTSMAETYDRLHRRQPPFSGQ